MAKILVVDDELEILALLKTFLTRKGFQVITADNGEKALEIIDEEEAIDLLILDHRMPKLDGSAVLEELRERKKKFPVIFLTGSLGKWTRELKTDAFLMKPVDLNKLLENINELLKR